ncbi:MAG: hypothetical protein AAF281_07275, partial [Pseudomonadota bacterium]
MTPWTLLLTYWRVPAWRNGLAAALFGLFLAYAGWSAALAPAQAELAAARANLAALSGERAALDQRRDLAARYRTLAAEEARLTARLNAGTDRSELVRRFTELSAASGTRIIHGANTLGRERGGLTPVLQDLTVEGSYAEVRQFLAGIDRLATLTVPVSVDMVANAEGTLVRAKLRFMTLSQGEG